MILSFHVDNTMGKGGDSIIPRGSYTMGKGGDSIIPRGSYTMGKGGDSIIPRGSYNIQWKKVVIPSFHVDHIIYNGKRWSFHHSKWII